MEIEAEPPNITKNRQSQPVTNEDQLKNNYLSQILGIKLTESDLKLFSNSNDFSQYLSNNLKFNDKKKNEIKDCLIDDVKKSEKSKSIEEYKEEKSKKFSENLKLNGKTIIYLTAEKDELSKTMRAFYFSDKSKQVFSDKQTAEYKAIHFDTGYDLNLENTFKHNKDEDNLSSYSNLANNNENNTVPADIKFNKKKRKNSTNFSSKSKSCKKKKTDKNTVSEDCANNNSKGENDIEGQDGEYCIINCKYNRKSKGQPMIQCDRCKKWYHTKCLSFTNEQFLKYDGKGKIWFCPSCSKIEGEDKKANSGTNGNSGKN